MSFSGFFIEPVDISNILLTGFSAGQNTEESAFLQKLNNNGENIWTKQVINPDNVSILPISLTTLPDNSIILYLSVVYEFEGWANFMVKLDESASNIEWISQIGLSTVFSIYSKLAIANESMILAAQTKHTLDPINSHSPVISKLSPDGNIEWNYKLKYSDHHQAHATSLTLRPNDGYLLSAIVSDTTTQVPSSGTLIWLEEEAVISKTKSYENTHIGYSESFSNGDVLISGNYISGQGRHAFFAKTNSNGDIIWAKKVHSNADPAYSFCHALPLEDGSCIAYYSNGILIKVDATGTIEWQVKQNGNSTPIRESGMLLNSNGYVTLGVDELNQKTILLKTDLNGNVDDCPSLETCLFLEEIQINTFTHNWDRTDYEFETFPIDLEISDMEVSYTDYCENLNPPSPEFLIPDTTCISDCIYPENLQQQDAEAWQWTGAEIELPTAQDPGSLCFTEAGQFEIQQTIYIGGCPDSFQTGITVMPIPVLDLPDDSIVCTDPPIYVEASSANGVSYVWEDLSTSAIRSIFQSGNYSVTVSDAYCSNSDTINVVFINGVEIDLGEDSLICKETELLIEPDVTMFDDFWWNDDYPESLRTINTEGSYIFSAIVEGCLFADTIYINVENCQESIYIPNAFSPNADGQNDVFTAYGNHHLIESFKIFNRWGGVVWEMDGNETWDGTSNGELVQNGTYVYLLQYTDTRTGVLKMKHGDVTLFR